MCKLKKFKHGLTGIVCAAVTITIACFSAIAAAGSSANYGDLNYDGKVNIADIVALKQYITDNSSDCDDFNNNTNAVENYIESSICK